MNLQRTSFVNGLAWTKLVASKGFVILTLGFAVLCNSCVFGAYGAVSDTGTTIRDLVIGGMQIKIDELEEEVKILSLRQDYLEEILILILPPSDKPYDRDDREEETSYAI